MKLFSECLMLWPHSYPTNDHRWLGSIHLHVYVCIHTHVYTCILCIHGCMKVSRDVKVIISVWKYVGMWKCSSASYCCILSISPRTTGGLGVWIYIYMYTNVYMYICMLCMHNCMNVCRDVEMFSERCMLLPHTYLTNDHWWLGSIHSYMYVYILNLYMYVYIYILVYIYIVFTYVCIQIYTCIYICTCIYIYVVHTWMFACM